MKSTEVDQGLFTDTYCKVCSAQLISESQRVAHYEVRTLVFQSVCHSDFPSVSLPWLLSVSSDKVESQCCLGFVWPDGWAGVLLLLLLRKLWQWCVLTVKCIYVGIYNIINRNIMFTCGILTWIINIHGVVDLRPTRVMTDDCFMTLWLLHVCQWSLSAGQLWGCSTVSARLTAALAVLL